MDPDVGAVEELVEVEDGEGFLPRRRKGVARSGGDGPLRPGALLGLGGFAGRGLGRIDSRVELWDTSVLWRGYPRFRRPCRPLQVGRVLCKEDAAIFQLTPANLHGVEGDDTEVVAELPEDGEEGSAVPDVVLFDKVLGAFLLNDVLGALKEVWDEGDEGCASGLVALDLVGGDLAFAERLPGGLGGGIPGDKTFALGGVVFAFRGTGAGDAAEMTFIEGDGVTEWGGETFAGEGVLEGQEGLLRGGVVREGCGILGSGLRDEGVSDGLLILGRLDGVADLGPRLGRGGFGSGGGLGFGTGDGGDVALGIDDGAVGHEVVAGVGAVFGAVLEEDVAGGKDAVDLGPGGALPPVV